MINLPIGHGLVGTAIYKGKAVIITEDEGGQMFVFDNDSPEIASEQERMAANNTLHSFFEGVKPDDKKRSFITQEEMRALYEEDAKKHDIRNMTGADIIDYFSKQEESNKVGFSIISEGDADLIPVGVKKYITLW